MQGKLFVVSLPIGNLEDITLRAISILKNVDLILCEDTREFIKIAKTYDILKTCESFHDFNEKEKTKTILKKLENGQNIAIVSDRGTPTLSDPGFFLIKEYAHRLGTKVSGAIVPVPGASSILAAQSICSFDSKFLFYGFVKKNELKNLVNVEFPIIFFEAPHRINAFFENLHEVFGNRKIFIAREISKIYEEFFYVNLEEAKIENPRGEFTIILDKPRRSRASLSSIDAHESLLKEVCSLDLNISNKDMSTLFEKVFAIDRKLFYEKIFQIKEENQKISYNKIEGN